MDEDEYDEILEEKIELLTSSASINYADLLMVAMNPVKGLLVGAVGALDHLHGLLGLHSNHLDNKKRQKEAAKDLEKMLNG